MKTPNTINPVYSGYKLFTKELCDDKDNLSTFWELLTQHIEKIKNLSDIITIRVLGLSQEGILVNNYDFNYDKSKVTVYVGEDMELKLFRKCDFKYLDRYVFEDDTYLLDLLDIVMDELSEKVSFTKQLNPCEVLL